MKPVQYKTGDPKESGVYACRVPSERLPGFYDDVFLLWHDAKWWYVLSDQRYRDPVPFWIGPLQRKML